MRVAASLAILLVAACSVHPRLPSQGGPAWTEVKSEHFTLWTDASTTRGHELVRALERGQRMITAVMNRPPLSKRIFVIALGTPEVESYAGGGYGGFSWRADNPTAQPGMLVAADIQDLARIANHELTHVISADIVHKQPRWVAEGMAAYFETAELDASGTSVRIGQPPSNIRLLASWRRPVGDLFVREGLRADNVFYAKSWLLFAYLVNEHYDKLMAYLQQLEALPKDRQLEAWRETFPDLTFDRLDALLYAWVRHGNFQFLRMKVAEVRDFPAAVRRLGDADVLAARSLIWLAGYGRASSAARTNATAALAIDRTNVLAQLVKAEVTGAISPDDARATAAAHPDDWHAWRLVMRALRGSPEASQARVRLCTLAPQTVPECAAPTESASEAKR
jgi:hypothetical protein